MPKRVRFAIALSGFLIVLFLFPPYIPTPHTFLPSAAYVESVTYFALLAAALCAMIGFAVAVYYPFNMWRRVTGLAHLVNVIFVPIVFALFGHMFVTTTIPLYVALLWGGETSMTFTVESLEHTDKRSCETSVHLAEMPMAADELCDLPPNVLQQLTSGTEIVVTGRGTHMGLFAENARLMRPATVP